MTERSDADSIPEDDRWHVQLLGGVRVSRFGVELQPFSTEKSRLLLAVLAIANGEQVPRSTLREMLWAEAQGPDKALRTELGRLKERLNDLPSNPIGSGTSSDRIEPVEPYAHARRHAALDSSRFVIDVINFERAVARAVEAKDRESFIRHAEQARADYGGPFMPGFGDWHWVDEQRSRLEIAYADILLGLIERYDDPERVIEVAKEAVTINPFDEWPYLARMRAHHKRGERHVALEVYRQLEEALAEADVPLSDDAQGAWQLIHADRRLRGKPILPGRQTEATTRRSAPSGTVAFLAARIGAPESVAGGGEPEAAVNIAIAMLKSQTQAIDGMLVSETHGATVMCAFNMAVDAMIVAADVAAAATMLRQAPLLAMGIHVGDAALGDTEAYVSRSPGRAAALAASAAPGQILVSDVARALAEEDLPTSLWFDGAGYMSQPGTETTLALHNLRSERTRLTFFPPIGKPTAPTEPPHPTDPFFGRHAELTALCTAFVDENRRLVTLHGPGGIGKTRLAIQAADRVSEKLGLAPRWVDLSAIGEGEAITATFVEALGAPLRYDAYPRDELLVRLRDTPTLLLVDNAEQVVTAVAQLADELLAQVSNLRILVTSRRLLNVSVEHPIELDPLPVEPLDRGAALASEARVDPAAADEDLGAAAALFIDRAQAARRDFDAQGSREEIARLCHLLEGIPLAIELAAARAGVLSPGQMITRLNDRFRLLDTARGRYHSRPDLPERHRSLRAAIDASWSLLSPEAQTLFARASTFRGGFTLEALEAVCNVPDTLEHLAALRDAAMLRAVHGGPELRFQMLETLREYGEERLEADEEEAQVLAMQARHAEHFLRLSEEALPELSAGPVKPIWLRLLDGERDNLRRALRWLDAQSEVSHGLRMSGALWRYWFERGQLSEGRRHVERFLAVASPEDRSLEHALALHAAGTLATYSGDLQSAVELLEASLAIRRERVAKYGDTYGDERMLAYTINNLGAVTQEIGDYSRAKVYLEESLERKRQAGDVLRLTSTLYNLSTVCLILGDRRGLESVLEEMLEIAEETGQTEVIARVHRMRALERVHRGDFQEARTLLDSATMTLGEEVNEVSDAPELIRGRGLEAHWSGRFEEAERCYVEALELARRRQNRAAETGTLRFLGELALDRGKLEEAQRFLREALALARVNGSGLGASGAQYVLGRALTRRGDLEQARPLLLSSLRYRVDLGSLLPITECLEAWCEWLAAEGDVELARRAAGAALALRREHGYPRPAHQAAAQARVLAQAGVVVDESDDPPPDAAAWRGVVVELVSGTD